MKQISTPQDVKLLGTILCVWAHPDDESFSCAGIMAAAIANGQKVICSTATKGEAGIQDQSRWPADKLGEIRANEMQEALNHLGVNHHIWLGYKDGKCQQVDDDEAVSKIRELIAQYKPNSILTFGPDGMTGHPDHQAVSHWVDKASDGTNIKVFHAVEEEDRYQKYMIEADKKFNIYFNIDKPPVYQASHCDIAFKLPSDVLFKKRLALKSMPSQTERMFLNTPTEMMNAMLAQECFILAA